MQQAFNLFDPVGRKRISPVRFAFYHKSYPQIKIITLSAGFYFPVFNIKCPGAFPVKADC